MPSKEQITEAYELYDVEALYDFAMAECGKRESYEAEIKSLKQARLSALHSCRDIAEKSQNKYLQVTQDEGIPVTERNRQRSMMLAVKSVNDEIQSLIDKEGSKEE